MQEIWSFWIASKIGYESLTPFSRRFVTFSRYMILHFIYLKINFLITEMSSRFEQQENFNEFLRTSSRFFFLSMTFPQLGLKPWLLKQKVGSRIKRNFYEIKNLTSFMKSQKYTSNCATGTFGFKVFKPLTRGYLFRRFIVPCKGLKSKIWNFFFKEGKIPVISEKQFKNGQINLQSVKELNIEKIQVFTNLFTFLCS